jgi:hypothetical protein
MTGRPAQCGFADPAPQLAGRPPRELCITQPDLSRLGIEPLVTICRYMITYRPEFDDPGRREGS